MGQSRNVENLCYSRANRCSCGDPFRLLGDDQCKAMRSRMVRIGIDAHF